MQTGDDKAARSGSSIPSSLITLLATAAVVVIGAILFGSGRKDRDVAKLAAPDSSPQPPPAKVVSKPAAVTEKSSKTDQKKTAPPPISKKTPEPVLQPAAIPMTTKGSLVGPPQVATPEQRAGDQVVPDARATYDRERAEFVKLIAARLAADEATAKGGGDEARIKQTVAAREAFEKRGQLPADAPAAAIEKMVTSRAAVEKLLLAELNAATVKNDQLLIKNAQNELTKFMATESEDIGNVVVRYPKSWFRLINVNSNLALGVHKQSKGRGAAVVQTTDDPGNEALQWRVKYLGTHYSRLQNRLSNHVLNVPASDRNQGAQLIQWNDDGGTNNFFELRYRGSHYYIRSLFSGHLVSVANARRDVDLQVIQWGGHDGNDQRWRLVRIFEDEQTATKPAN